jgi:hypothetical protein
VAAAAARVGLSALVVRPGVEVMVTPFEVGGVRAEMRRLRPKVTRALLQREWEDPDVPDGALTASAVHVNGQRIGVASSRRVGRERRWAATLVGFYSPHGSEAWRPVTDVRERRHVFVHEREAGGRYRTRKDAAVRLVRLWQELTGP